ncbi:MAG: aminotransferase class IV [Mycobacteriales bacterium]
MSDRVLAVVGRGVVDITTPILRGDDVGVTRGDGVFETMRVRNQRAFLFDDHLLRMQSGANRLALRLPPRADWHEVVREALTAYGDDTGVLRLFTTRGPDGADAPVSYLTVAPVPATTIATGRDGTRAVTLDAGISAAARADAPWLLGGVKTTSYAVAMAAKREAETRGATDAIWVSSDGEILEEATSSVVWVAGESAYTIPASTGILVGTTLDCIRVLAAGTGQPIADRRTTVADLRGADEVLLLSAVRGIAPVLTLDGAAVGSGRIGPVGRQLRAAFEGAFAAATSGPRRS